MKSHLQTLTSAQIYRISSPTPVRCIQYLSTANRHAEEWSVSDLKYWIQQRHNWVRSHQQFEELGEDGDEFQRFREKSFGIIETDISWFITNLNKKDYPFYFRFYIFFSMFFDFSFLSRSGSW
jgi:hypothetical protein